MNVQHPPAWAVEQAWEAFKREIAVGEPSAWETLEDRAWAIVHDGESVHNRSAFEGRMTSA